MTFASLGLSEQILAAVDSLGFKSPTPIQKQAIPLILKGHDLLASAQTGTGKTAGFVLPLLQRLSERPRAGSNQALALILAPTRELAVQIHETVVAVGRPLNIRSVAVYGGVKVSPQMMALRGGVEVLVATPGRLLDLFSQNAIKFDALSMFILDEADRMLDMGFINDIKKIMSKLPFKRQSMLFSATFSNDIRQLAKALLREPKEVDAGFRNATAEKVMQVLHPVDKAKKLDLLIHLIEDHRWMHALVFSRTKHGANKIVKELNAASIRSAAIHGNKSQAQRMSALEDFKSGKLQILVATDIASRGIDIEKLERVVNFDLPNVPEDYVHRIGRTARAGQSGQAISLVSADEVNQLADIERLLKQAIKRVEIEDFEPVHALPVAKPQASKTPRVHWSQKPTGQRKTNGTTVVSAKPKSRTTQNRSFVKAKKR